MLTYIYMEQQNFDAGIEVEKKNPIFKVTTLSKYLALMLFILLPFIGAWIGYTYAPEKVVEVERVVIRQAAPGVISDEENITDILHSMEMLVPDFEGIVSTEKIDSYYVSIKVNESPVPTESQIVRQVPGTLVRGTLLHEPAVGLSEYNSDYWQGLHEEYYKNELEKLGFEIGVRVEKLDLLTTVYQKRFEDKLQVIEFKTFLGRSNDCDEEEKNINFYGLCQSIDREEYTFFVSDLFSL